MSDDSAMEQPVEERHGLGIYKQRGPVLVSGSGAWVTDRDGRRLLDLTGAYGVAALGHCHPRIVRAVTAQAQRLINCFGTFGNDERSALLSELAAKFAPRDRFFLANSGTEAVEAALKLARATTGKPGVLATMRGFHGRTLGALSATWDRTHRDPFLPLLPHFRHVAYNDAPALEESFADDVGAVIVEPVQGEGGVRPGTPEFLLAAQRLCRDRGALLIVDEVQTGFGRTGRLLASEHFGLDPDLVCLGKAVAGGFPLGLVAAGPRVQNLAPGAHGSTFGGNPLACAAARAALMVLDEEGLMKRAEELGHLFCEGVRNLGSHRVREVRGLGLMVGVELKERAGPYLVALQQAGILALPAGPTVLRFLPPLVTPAEDLQWAVATLGRVLSEG